MNMECWEAARTAPKQINGWSDAVTLTLNRYIVAERDRAGGSNSIKNLWPESHRTSPWNAQVKERLEGKLHELVCRGQLKPNFQEKVLSLLCDFASEMQCDSPSWRDRRLQCMQRNRFSRCS